MFKKIEKENYTNHKNRKYSILLLALLFIGVATYGTYAYFTDSKNVASNITLAKGSVKLGDVIDQDWTYQGNNEGNTLSANPKFNPALTINQKAASFENVLPGDVFTRVVTIEYTGTNQAIGKLSNIPDNVTTKVTLNGTEITNLNTFDLKAKDTLSITLTTAVAYGSPENFGANESRNNGDSLSLFTLANAITFDVTQKLATQN